MSISIVIQGRDDIRPVANFLTENALERFQTNAPFLPDIFCVGYQGEELVACCGASLARDRQLYLEQIYEIDESIQEEIAGNRSAFCEIGRWMSKVAEYAPRVLRGVVNYVQAEGAEIAICEMAKPSMRRATVLGLPFTEINATLNLDAVDPIARKYYKEQTPALYRLELAAIEWR